MNNNDPDLLSFFGGFVVGALVVAVLSWGLFYTNPDQVRCEAVGGKWAAIDKAFACVQTSPVITPAPRAR